MAIAIRDVGPQPSDPRNHNLATSLSSFVWCAREHDRNHKGRIEHENLEAAAGHTSSWTTVSMTPPAAAWLVIRPARWRQDALFSGWERRRHRQIQLLRHNLQQLAASPMQASSGAISTHFVFTDLAHQ